MDAQPARLRGQNALWKDSDVNVGICLKNWLNLFLVTSTIMIVRLLIIIKYCTVKDKSLTIMIAAIWAI